MARGDRPRVPHAVHVQSYRNRRLLSRRGRCNCRVRAVSLRPVVVFPQGSLLLAGEWLLPQFVCDCCVWKREGDVASVPAESSAGQRGHPQK
eukprot:3905428-Alexandrium_andersonii.AAC.1